MQAETITVWSFAEPANVPDLIFDNFAGLLTAGRRNLVLADRHLVCREGSIVIDVHIENDEADGALSIAGQVQVDPDASETDQVGSWPVLLVNGPRVIRSTKTGRNGEFLLSATRPLDA